MNRTSYSHFPTVTATVTKKKNFCQAETTKTTTEGKSSAALACQVFDCLRC